LVLFGGVACSAQADSGPPGASSATPGASAAPSGSRQPIDVRLSPAKVTTGANRNVHVLALCPIPQGGTDHTATVSSKAFTGAVTLTPAPPVTPRGSSSPAASPELRGTAIVPAKAKAGIYTVTVRCEGTNDSGRARLTVLSEPSTTHKATHKPHHTRVPTGAPHAGGGGTAAGGPDDTSGLPAPVTGLALIGALAVGIAVARRKRS
jgi:hypothetical protein